MTFDGLSPPYATIVADPPWHYNDRLMEFRTDKPDRRADMPYSTMSNEDIAALPVGGLSARSAHLYLWTTNQHVWTARDIVLGWGFQPVQLLVWAKPPQGHGLGGVFSNTTEFVIYARQRLTAARQVVRAGALIRAARAAAGLTRDELYRLVRGKPVTGLVQLWETDDCLPNERDWTRLCEVLPALKDVSRPVVEPPSPRDVNRVDSSWWSWPRPSGHSTKPPAFLDIVEQVSPGPYVELFARAPRLGWDSWGYGFEGAA